MSMHGDRRLVTALHWFHKHFLWILIATYAVAAYAPAAGLMIRSVSFGTIHLFGGSTHLTLPAVMLGLLLLNAGLGVRTSELKRLLTNPGPLVFGLAANLLVPILFIALVSLSMDFWHNADELQSILVGLALVASMPIAGSSSAWAQNADGDLALSLGLVLISTLVSPLTTPLSLHAAGLMTQGDYATSLHQLATHGTGAFLIVCVVFPSLLGILLRQLLGDRLTDRMRPWLKLANSANLLVLCYSNAAISLPQAVAQPDLDFLAAILAITGGLCMFAFGSGWGLGHLLRLQAGGRASLMYGLGMNNNGTGLVLASFAFADHPRILLPIIMYNLVQQVVAGGFNALAANAPKLEPRGLATAAG
ncbi:bile acid:Na+ symporter, BASS family [Singulisphaera sp. GP187]|uniref:bile acid:sodium symporter family protein n=1 Tax=Singulisphaera sp. GP187 TaxID=1882752 RepID=UPI000928C01A|nr:bile acid:sodium symporter [Singulisphaera sp. GP187]SIO59309.1 bile acid:Na+ symporter, BASS family [Singulisphaera sp. GP187]